MKLNIATGFLMLVMLFTAFSADAFAQPGKKKGHHKGNKHHKVYHHKGKHYKQRPTYVRERIVIVEPAPVVRRVYAPAPPAVVVLVPVHVPGRIPVPPLPPHPGLPRR